MIVQKICPLCGDGTCQTENRENTSRFICNNCGEFVLWNSWERFIDENNEKYDLDKLRIFIFHNRIKRFIIGNKDMYLTHAIQCKEYPFITIDEINNWYPKNIQEEIDYILLKLAELSDFYGDIVYIDKSIAKDLFFINIKDENDPDMKINVQASFIEKCLKEDNLIEVMDMETSINYHCNLILTPGLNKAMNSENQVNNKNVFVAMSFHEDEKDIMLTIKKAIQDSGYNPLPICDVPHNNWIMPEIFHAIKMSKFVVVDLTTHNLGAYYESGYAEGLGKQVIHTCKKEDFEKATHFDVKQKATIVWEKEEQLYKELKTRIEATIN